MDKSKLTESISHYFNPRNGSIGDIKCWNSPRNVALLIALLTIYARIYKSTKALIAVGLMFFAGMLMLHNIIAVYAYFAMEPLYAIALVPYFVVVHIAELAGIAVLLRVTL